MNKKSKKKHKETVYYAVRNGRHPGIYNTWDECYLEVAGFTNAVYKKFYSLEEAVEWTKPGPKSKQIKTTRIHHNKDGDTTKTTNITVVGNKIVNKQSIFGSTQNYEDDPNIPF